MDIQLFCGKRYAVYCPGDATRANEKTGHHGVGVAIKESILEETGRKCVAVECISDRLVKVWPKLKVKKMESLL